MFKKSDKSPQYNLYTSGEPLFSGKSLHIYQDSRGWHNEFRKQVTMQIDESLSGSLYSSNKGTPNAPIRVMVSMMVLKGAEGSSDQKLFENCRFNMLVRRAIGLLNADDPVYPRDLPTIYFVKKWVDMPNRGMETFLIKCFRTLQKNKV